MRVKTQEVKLSISDYLRLFDGQAQGTSPAVKQLQAKPARTINRQQETVPSAEFYFRQTLVAHEPGDIPGRAD